MRLDSITVSARAELRCLRNLTYALLLPAAVATSRARLFGHHRSMPDDHSPLEPRLPISNRTVKRRRADDSADYPCESRSLSGTPPQQKSPPQVGFFAGTSIAEAVSASPRLDFGYPRPRAKGIRDVDSYPVGEEWRERHAALDQVVARDRRQRDPVRCRRSPELQNRGRRVA